MPPDQGIVSSQRVHPWLCLVEYKFVHQIDLKIQHSNNLSCVCICDSPCGTPKVLLHLGLSGTPSDAMLCIMHSSSAQPQRSMAPSWSDSTCAVHDYLLAQPWQTYVPMILDIWDSLPRGDLFSTIKQTPALHTDHVWFCLWWYILWEPRHNHAKAS